MDNEDVLTAKETENEKFISCKETAKIVRTSEPMVFEWVRNGTLTSPVVARIGRKILINERELKNWLHPGGTAQKQVQAA